MFIEFYSSDCQACSEIAPTWTELAQDVKDISKLKIANFNIDFNDAPDMQITRVPTIMLVENGQIKEPLFYELNNLNKLTDFKKFLYKHSTVYKTARVGEFPSFD
jgi:thiol-disulfide isomerase/thioredoxin